jgi:hypothetical protein
LVLALFGGGGAGAAATGAGLMSPPPVATDGGEALDAVLGVGLGDSLACSSRTGNCARSNIAPPKIELPIIPPIECARADDSDEPTAQLCLDPKHDERGGDCLH